MGIRRNFVPRRWKVAPYLDGQLGLGEIDAKGPLGVAYAQGQNFTFTLNLGSGVRYNLNPRYSIEAGMHYMHISNLYQTLERKKALDVRPSWRLSTAGSKGSSSSKG